MSTGRGVVLSKDVRPVPHPQARDGQQDQNLRQELERVLVACASTGIVSSTGLVSAVPFRSGNVA